MPVVPRDVIDCFELARDIRSLDLRAAPFDLRPSTCAELGCEPVHIETAECKKNHAAEQRGPRCAVGRCGSASSMPVTASCSDCGADSL